MVDLSHLHSQTCNLYWDRDVIASIQPTALFSQWTHALDLSRYGGEHKAPELQKEAVYGLTELNREAVKSARLVANPGCYPTSVQLPLCPLLEVMRCTSCSVPGPPHSLPSSYTSSMWNDKHGRDQRLIRYHYLKSGIVAGGHRRASLRRTTSS